MCDLRTNFEFDKKFLFFFYFWGFQDSISLCSFAVLEMLGKRRGNQERGHETQSEQDEKYVQDEVSKPWDFTYINRKGLI